MHEGPNSKQYKGMRPVWEVEQHMATPSHWGALKICGYGGGSYGSYYITQIILDHLYGSN